MVGIFPAETGSDTIVVHGIGGILLFAGCSVALVVESIAVVRAYRLGANYGRRNLVRQAAPFHYLFLDKSWFLHDARWFREKQQKKKVKSKIHWALHVSDIPLVATLHDTSLWNLNSDAFGCLSFDFELERALERFCARNIRAASFNSVQLDTRAPLRTDSYVKA